MIVAVNFCSQHFQQKKNTESRFQFYFPFKSLEYIVCNEFLHEKFIEKQKNKFNLIINSEKKKRINFIKPFIFIFASNIFLVFFFISYINNIYRLIYTHIEWFLNWLVGWFHIQMLSKIERLTFCARSSIINSYMSCEKRKIKNYRALPTPVQCSLFSHKCVHEVCVCVFVQLELVYHLSNS